MKTRKLTEDEFNQILNVLFEVCKDMTEIKSVLKEYIGISRNDIQRLKSALKAKCLERTKENSNKYNKDWNKKHRLQINEYQRAYYKCNAEKLREYRRLYYKSHNNACIEYTRKYKERNKDRILSRNRVYYYSKVMPKVYLRNYLSREPISKVRQKAVYGSVKCWLSIQQYFVGV